MNKNAITRREFFSKIPVGRNNITRHMIWELAKLVDPSITAGCATVGWAISKLKAEGHLVQTGTGKHGAHLYQRVK